jgi:hypothetical protein
VGFLYDGKGLCFNCQEVRLVGWCEIR